MGIQQLGKQACTGAFDNGLGRNAPVWRLHTSSSFIMLHKCIPELTHTVPVQVLLERGPGHVGLARQNVQHSFNWQRFCKHVLFLYPGLQQLKHNQLIYVNLFLEPHT